MASIRQLPWDMDRVKDKGKSSLDVLLEWITTGANYARWRDGSIEKSSLCSEIQTLLQEQGIKHRNEQDIRNKIQAFEKSIKAAKRMIIRSGKDENITAVESFENDTLEQKILKECPIFNTLAPVMVPHLHVETRSSTKRQRRDTAGAAAATTASTTQPTEGEGENVVGGALDESLDTNENSELFGASDDEAAFMRETSALEQQDIREQFELKRAKREIEFQESKTKSEMALVVERALCRQRLIKAGILPAEVENVLPRKRLVSETDEF